MKKFFLLLLLTIPSFNVGLISSAYSQTTESAKGMAMCDRIQKQAICEEYRLSTLTSADKKIIERHCTSDALCPEQNRVARCLKFKDPDDVVFDKHYYRDVTDKEEWQPGYIEETCTNNNGKYIAD